MPSFVRLLAVGLLVVAASGCGGSNNKGKIEGRWKFVSVGDRPADAPLQNASLLFREDGSVTLERDGPTPAPDSKVQPPRWKYKLLAGDDADFYDLPADATERFGFFPAKNGVCRVTIKIESKTGGKYEDREMTLTDASGQTLKLTWLR